MFLLVPAYPGSPDQRPLNGCACVCVYGPRLKSISKFKPTVQEHQGEQELTSYNKVDQWTDIGH